MHARLYFRSFVSSRGYSGKWRWRNALYATERSSSDYSISLSLSFHFIVVGASK